MNARPLRCLIWCAVSSHAQNEPDKISLPQQENESRAMAHRQGWQILEVLRVPGHSRRYIDFHELAKDASKEGIEAFNRLMRHWEARDFDVLVVRDGERFARTQALHAYVTERTIDIGAKIYSLQDGWVDDENHRMWIAMAGYKAAGDIDRLIKSRNLAMNARAQRGLPISSRVPISHNLLRDPNTGKALRLEVDETKRRLWDDLAKLVLEGVSWDRMDLELYQRFGHVDAKGRPYYSGYMYRLIMKPLFWGHIARFHHSTDSKNGFRYGRWIYDEAEPMPEGTVIYRNTHPAVWNGELADKIRQEIDRRSEHIRGKSSSSYTHRFSGLFICAKCSAFMGSCGNTTYRGIRCAGTGKTLKLQPCDNRGATSERKLIVWVNEYLEQMLQQKSTEVFGTQLSQEVSVQSKLETLDADITKLEDQARVIIRKQISAEESLQRIYDEEIAKLGEELRIVKEVRLKMQGEVSTSQHLQTVQQMTLEELASLTLETFWQQESRYINQILHRLMGKRRFIILKGEIIGVAEVQRKQRRRI